MHFPLSFSVISILRIGINLPLHLTHHILELIQCSARLDDRIPQHSRIQTQGPAHGVLRPGGAVEAHDKVVAGVVRGVVFAHGFGEVEDAPVCDTADDAAGVEDYAAGGFCDSF